MKRLYITIVLIFFFAFGFSQVNESEGFIQEDEQEQLSVNKEQKEKKVYTNIAVGSFFMTSGKNSYALNTYVNPTIAYRFTPKFSLSVGLMAIQSNINNLNVYNLYEGQTQSLNYSGMNTYFTLQGAYQWSEKLKIYGGVMIGTASKDFLNTDVSAPNAKVNPKAYQLGFEYKIGKYSSLIFEMEYRETNYIPSPQMRHGSSFNMMRQNSSFLGSQAW